MKKSFLVVVLLLLQSSVYAEDYCNNLNGNWHGWVARASRHPDDRTPVQVRVTGNHHNFHVVMRRENTPEISAQFDVYCKHSDILPNNNPYDLRYGFSGPIQGLNGRLVISTQHDEQGFIAHYEH